MGVEEWKAFWEGAKEFFTQPIVFGGTSITLLGLIALIVRMFLTIPKNKQISSISRDMTTIKNERNNYVTINDYNALVDYSKRQAEFMLTMVSTIKNQTLREEYDKQAHELINNAPREIIIVVEKPKEKEISKF